MGKWAGTRVDGWMLGGSIYEWMGAWGWDGWVHGWDGMGWMGAWMGSDG